MLVLCKENTEPLWGSPTFITINVYSKIQVIRPPPSLGYKPPSPSIVTLFELNEEKILAVMNTT